MATDATLDIRNLTVALPADADREHAVEGIDLTLNGGEILCVVGESGSGKSVTANAVMGLLPSGVRPIAGEILFDGHDLLKVDETQARALRGSRLCMIFQEPMTALNPLMRVGEQIEEVFEAHNVLDRGARRARVLELLDEVGLPDPERLIRAYPHQLSGGQRQRVMIAIALALEPAVLIADEPTTALDVTTQAQILALIRRIQESHGMAVLFITHDFGVVAEIADRVAVMREGRIVELGAADTILNRPTHAYTQALIEAVPPLDPPALTKPPKTRPVLEVAGLTKVFETGGGLFRRARRVMAADSVSFVLHEGETVGLVGESGSGKTTVGRCIVRLIKPDGGEIRLGDADLVPLSGKALRPHRARVQLVFQDPFASLNPRKQVGRIIADGPIAQGRPASEALAEAARLLALVGLQPSAATRYPHEFSGGQRQRIGIARALALKPEVLVADEAVSALDVSVQAQILDLIRDIRDEFNLALLFITHDLRVAAQVCDRIAVMQNGAIVELADTQSLFRAPQHAYTRSLLQSVPGADWRRSHAHPA